MNHKGGKCCLVGPNVFMNVYYWIARHDVEFADNGVLGEKKEHVMTFTWRWDGYKFNTEYENWQLFIYL